MDFARLSQCILPTLLILWFVAPIGIQVSPVCAQSTPFADEQPTSEPSPEITRKLKLVETQCAAGNFTAALQTALSISDPTWRDQAVGTVALYQARAGDSANALRTVARMQSYLRQVHVLTFIASIQNANPNVPKWR
jgi:hypothetical protein